ncbi:MAG: hypothetical protein R2834_02605 [Rhodothermales bacterium]
MSTTPQAKRGLPAANRLIPHLLLAALFSAFALPVLAQTGSYPPPPPDDIIRTEFAAKNMKVDMLSMYNLSGMSEQWWKDLAAAIDTKLVGTDAEKEDGMRMIVFLATYYPDKADFSRNATELYNIYRFDGKEEFRVMALAALYAEGDDAAMRLIAYHTPYAKSAPWESNDLVRRVTDAAIARHFGTPSVTVEPPTMIRTAPPN